MLPNNENQCIRIRIGRTCKSVEVHALDITLKVIFADEDYETNFRMNNSHFDEIRKGSFRRYEVTGLKTCLNVFRAPLADETIQDKNFFRVDFE